jgi:hypothetical protein
VGRSQAPAPDTEVPRPTRQTSKSTAKSIVTYEPGANFVDATLRVVVEQSAGTVISFQPAHLHGTSIGYGASNDIISINFSKRVGDAWAEARASGHSVSILSRARDEEGAGLDEDVD